MSDHAGVEVRAPDRVEPTTDVGIRACRACGLAQEVPGVPGGMRACCARCGTELRGIGASSSRANTSTAAIALAALILYPLAVSLPMLRVHQLGHHSESSILGGATSLLANGHILVGVIVLLCSVVFPLGKLVLLLLLTSGVGRRALTHRDRALTYRLIEWTGRWGMLDVLLVAILVAALKLGDWMQVQPGPAVVAFTTCVLLSLLAAATFDPHALWEHDQ